MDNLFLKRLYNLLKNNMILEGPFNADVGNYTHHWNNLKLFYLRNPTSLLQNFPFKNEMYD
jgi:hypothetical protein